MQWLPCTKPAQEASGCVQGSPFCAKRLKNARIHCYVSQISPSAGLSLCYHHIVKTVSLYAGPYADIKPDVANDVGKADNSGKTDGCLGYVRNMAEGHAPDVFGKYIWTSMQYKVWLLLPVAAHSCME